MWDNKLKAVTFSFDDGVLNDKRLIELLDKYNLKATFNINSGKDGVKWVLDFPNGPLDHITFHLSELKDIYKNHEIAGHTLTHPSLLEINDEEVIRQVKEDNENLSKIVGYEVVGFAYPGGPPNSNDHVAKLIRENTNVKYARVVESSYSFDPQENLLLFKPTLSWCDPKFDKMVEEFIKLKPNKPQLFYIWGHSYEADGLNMWERIEKIFKKLANRDDIYYGTNKEVFLK